MAETAQIIFAASAGLAFVLIAITWVIWVLRCPPDSPTYRPPSLPLFRWRGD